MADPAVRTLAVYTNDKAVGTITDQNGIWSFAYSEAWRTSPESFDLAPLLPRAEGNITDKSSVRPVQWFFDNLLPEEDARELLAREAKLDRNDAFAILAYYGAESAGALTLRPPGEDTTAPMGLKALSDNDLHERIANLPNVSLAAASPKRMSLAGAQHKLPIVIQGEALFEPVGATPSTHILKPDHRLTDIYPHTAANEFFTMRVAAAVKLPVPQVGFRRIPDSIYLIARFDRIESNGAVIRRHAIDACQLLGIDRTFKYESASLETLIRAIEACRSRAAARQAIYRWLIFNVLIGNSDAHLKNLSFFTTTEGIELAPHYDMLCTIIYDNTEADLQAWRAQHLTFKMGHATTFGELSRTDVIAAGKMLGVPISAASRQLDEFLKHLGPAAQAIYEEEEIKVRNGNRHAMAAGELRLLRQIRYVVLQEMQNQLA